MNLTRRLLSIAPLITCLSILTITSVAQQTNLRGVTPRTTTLSNASEGIDERSHLGALQLGLGTRETLGGDIASH